MPGRPRRNGDVILYAGGSIVIRVLQRFFVIRKLLHLRQRRSAHQVTPLLALVSAAKNTVTKLYDRHATDEFKKEMRKSWAECVKTREFRNLVALANDVVIIWRTGQYVVHHAKVLGQLGLMARRPCQAAVPFSGRHPVRAPPALAARMELESYTHFGQWRKTYPKCRDVALVARTRGVHARVVAASKLLCREANPAWHWRLHVYEESSAALLNASAFPCSQICIASGMVAECRSDDELAGILAHVLAYHTLERFALREVVVPAAESLMTLQGGLPAPEQLLLGPVAPGACLTLAAAATAHWSDGCALLLGELAARTANAALWSVYSRSCEAEADWCGYHISEAAGYDPDGLFHKFSIIEWREAAQLARLATLPRPLFWLRMLLRSHPLQADRRAALRRLTVARRAAQQAAQQSVQQQQQQQQRSGRRRRRGLRRTLVRVLSGVWKAVAVAELGSRALR